MILLPGPCYAYTGNSGRSHKYETEPPISRSPPVPIAIIRTMFFLKKINKGPAGYVLAQHNLTAVRTKVLLQYDLLQDSREAYQS